MLTIRKATLADLGAITEIYNEAILKTVATFDTEPKTEAEQKRWFDHHGPRYPILVAEEANLIVGWASLSLWSVLSINEMGHFLNRTLLRDQAVFTSSLGFWL
jgi:L-amino acid N-acyltransferase YncA